jgi:predicted metalloprotease with PDZ domain
MNRALLTAALVAVCSIQPTTCLSQEQPNANAVSLATQNAPATLVLDAREAPRGIMHSHMTIPVKPGTFTLVYPKWIPGEHGPTGPLYNLSQLRITADGRDLSWRRDNVDMYAFHVEVPANVDRVTVDFTVLLNAPGDTMATRNIAIVNWNRDLLYQNDINSHDYYVKPSVILPHGWSYGSALPGARQSGDRIDFDTVGLNMLVDSPLDMGRYYKHILLWQNGSAAQWLDAFADKPQDLDFPPQVVAEYKRMTPQALALYGSRHWNWYHSLLTLSGEIGFQGIEHHQSSDNRAPDDFMTDPREQIASGDLLTHEFSHSWNGKYRRPADLTTLNFQIPMQTDLLWVYEGMNQYLGDLLSFRMHIRDPKSYPEYVANIYAQMDSEPGRLTTPIIDTTTGAPYFYEARGAYSSLRRTAGDFYTEGHLIWLAADVIIREQTAGKKSLDDFLHLYTEPAVTGPITKTYTRADVERMLGEIAPYDWHRFFDRYVYQVSQHPPYDDLEKAGWRLVYTDKPNEFGAARDAVRHSVDDWYSIGVRVSGEGRVSDVRQGSPAWSAGLPSGAKIVAVNGQEFGPEALQYAIKAAQHASSSIQLLASQNGWYSTYTINYHGGLRYPHLVRIAGRPDILTHIASPR